MNESIKFLSLEYPSLLENKKIIILFYFTLVNFILFIKEYNDENY